MLVQGQTAVSRPVGWAGGDDARWVSDAAVPNEGVKVKREDPKNFSGAPVAVG